MSQAIQCCCRGLVAQQCRLIPHHRLVLPILFRETTDLKCSGFTKQHMVPNDAVSDTTEAKSRNKSWCKKYPSLHSTRRGEPREGEAFLSWLFWVGFSGMGLGRGREQEKTKWHDGVCSSDFGSGSGMGLGRGRERRGKNWQDGVCSSDFGLGSGMGLGRGRGAGKINNGKSNWHCRRKIGLVVQIENCSAGTRTAGGQRWEVGRCMAGCGMAGVR